MRERERERELSVSVDSWNEWEKRIKDAARKHQEYNCEIYDDKEYEKILTVILVFLWKYSLSLPHSKKIVSLPVVQVSFVTLKYLIVIFPLSTGRIFATTTVEEL